MPVHNADLAAVFEEIADRLEIEGANPFRIRVYRNAARQLQAMGVPVADMVAKGEDLSELPSIGEDLAAKIKEIVETGKCQAFEKLRKQMPPTVTQLLQIPGLGPKRVRTLYHELDVQTLEQLGAPRSIVVLNSVAKSVVESARGDHPEYVFAFRGYRLHHIDNTGWKQARARAGLPQVRVHDLKHTFGRRLRAAGVSFEDRQDF